MTGVSDRSHHVPIQIAPRGLTVQTEKRDLTGTFVHVVYANPRLALRLQVMRGEIVIGELREALVRCAQYVHAALVPRRASISCRARHMILPLPDFGSSSTNSTIRGYL